MANKVKLRDPRRQWDDWVEAHTQRAILQFLGAHHIVAFRSNTGAFAGEYKGKRRFVRFGERGMPDIHGVLPGGRALFIEVKGARGKISVWQAAQIDRLRRQGAVAFVAYNVAEVAAMLEATTSAAAPSPAGSGTPEATSVRPAPPRRQGGVEAAPPGST